MRPRIYYTATRVNIEAEIKAIAIKNKLNWLRRDKAKPTNPFKS